MSGTQNYSEEENYPLDDFHKLPFRFKAERCDEKPLYERGYANGQLVCISKVTFNSPLNGEMITCIEKESDRDTVVFGLLQRANDYEAELLAHFKHPNIVELLFQPTFPRSTLYLKYYPAGDLYHLTTNIEGYPDSKYTAKMRTTILKDILTGMQHVATCLYQGMQVMHADLKSDNIFLKEDMHAVVGDFGSAYYIHEKTKLYECRTTYPVAAPELLANTRELQQHPKSDVYSYAMIMLEVLSRRGVEEFFPKDKTGKEILSMIRDKAWRPEIPQTQLFPDAKYTDIMQKCWAQKPDDRPDWGEALASIEEILQGLS